MQHSEANMQAGDSRIPEDLMHLLDELSGRVHQTRSCKRCGAVMTLFGAVFFLENGSRSWNIPLPICPRCEPTMELSTYITSKAA
jgi:hypothetical protein